MLIEEIENEGRVLGIWAVVEGEPDYAGIRRGGNEARGDADKALRGLNSGKVKGKSVKARRL